MSDSLLQSYVRDFKRNRDRMPWVTISLIGINVLIFLFMEILGFTEIGQTLFMKCVMHPDRIIEGKEYWRFLTSTFLHFDAQHLLNNMVLLGAAGTILERAMGTGRFLALYLISGVGGSILSCVQMLHSGRNAISAGASGAIFGLIGGLLWVVIVHRGRYESLTGKGLLFMIGLSLYYGITSAEVDNWGHIGGLIMGLVAAVILYRKRT